MGSRLWRNERLIGCSFAVSALLFLAAGQVALAQAGYEISIAGYTFDPLRVESAAPESLRMSRQERAAFEESPNYFLVQFRQRLDPQSKERLQAQYGLRLQEYIPELAYLERLEPDVRTRLSRDEAVRAIVPFEPAYRISPHIGASEFRSEERRSMPPSARLLLAVLFRDAEVGEVTESLSRLGATEIEVNDPREYGGTARIQFVLPAIESVRDVARLPGVRWIEEAAEYDEDNGNTAGTMQSGTPGTTPVWDVGLHGEGQTISVMEGSGADPNHCMFQDLVNPVGATHRKIQANFGSGGGHATFVSGIAVGDDLNNPGTGANRGNAWAARLVNVQAGSALNAFTQLTTSAAAGPTVFVHTNSWHGINVNASNQAIYDQISSDVDTFIWNNEDHVVLGSMGNNGEEQGPPGTAKNAIGINAGTTFPNIMNVGDGNPGPTAGGRRKPDVVTPGCNIQSARSGTTCTINQWGVCATSWATPAAAAASAMIRQYYVDGYYPSGAANPADSFAPSGALVKATLVNGTINMTGIAGYPSNLEGWGLVRLDNALYFQDDPHALQVWDTRNSNGLITGGSRTQTVNVTSSDSPLRVTLVWSDPPAAAGASNPAVNNLDLRVVSPGGTQTFLGNVFAGGVSVTGGVADTLNNVEQVVVNTPALGAWTIIVDATAVNVGNPGQGSAVVATAGVAEAVPQIQIPGPIDFGDVCVGSSKTATLSVCNMGTADLLVDPITSSNPAFSVATPSGGYPMTIAPGVCFPFQLSVSPTAPGPASTVLSLPTNDPISPVTQVQASVTGTVADIRVNGSTDFGTVSAWSSGEQTLEVCNVGGCPLNVSSATIGCPDFTIVSNPFPAAIDPGACLDLTIGFTPTVPGPKTCQLNVASDDPDSPVVSRTLTARTPPSFSLHAGVVDPTGTLSNTVKTGTTVNLDYIHPVGPHLSWDVRLGVSRFDGKAGMDDLDVWTLSANARHTFNPTAPVGVFVNGGLGLYHFNPGDSEAGLNVGLGLSIPTSPRYAFELTYNYHSAFTASPSLEYHQVQAGFRVSF